MQPCPLDTALPTNGQARAPLTRKPAQIEQISINIEPFHVRTVTFLCMNCFSLSCLSEICNYLHKRLAHFCLFLDVIYLLGSCEILFAYYYKIFIYLAVLGLSCGTQDLHCTMRDLSLWGTDSLTVVHGLQSTQVQKLWPSGLVVLWPVGS